MNHELKCWPQFFQAVLEGRKTFEVRRDDRGFQAGDEVTMMEYDPQAGPKAYTGRKARYRIGYVTGWEQKPGYVVFSLLPHGSNAELSQVAAGEQNHE